MCDLNKDFTPKRLENFSVKAGAAIFTHVARIAHLRFSCACKRWSKKKRLDRATCCLHAPKFEAMLFWSPPSWWDHIARHSFGCAVWRLWISNIQTASRKSWLLSEPSMFYQYFDKFGTHSKGVSPRWPPLISWLERWSIGSSIQSILNINACSISLVVLTSRCLLRFCVIAYALSYP